MMAFFKNENFEKEFYVAPTECCATLNKASARKHTACVMTMVGWVLEQSDDVDDLSTLCCYTIRKAHSVNHTKCVERMVYDWLQEIRYYNDESCDSSEEEQFSEGEVDLDPVKGTKCCFSLREAGRKDHEKCVFEIVKRETTLGTPVLKECCKTREQAVERAHNTCLVNIYRFRYFKICVPTECCKNIRQAVNQCHFSCVQKIGDQLPTEKPDDPELRELFESAVGHELRYMENLTHFYIRDRFGHLDLQID